MSEEKEYIPRSAMSIHAHPDDQEFSVAGTLAKWARAGCEITSVILTSGDGGSNDPAHDASYKPTLARIREGEQSAASEVLGVKKTIYMHLICLICDIQFRIYLLIHRDAFAWPALPYQNLQDEQEP